MSNLDGNKGMERGAKGISAYLVTPIKIKETWEEEFEIKLISYRYISVIADFIRRYLIRGKIKISAKKGKIVIKRIK